MGPHLFKYAQGSRRGEEGVGERGGWVFLKTQRAVWRLISSEFEHFQFQTQQLVLLETLFIGISTFQTQQLVLIKNKNNTVWGLGLGPFFFFRRGCLLRKTLSLLRSQHHRSSHVRHAWSAFRLCNCCGNTGRLRRRRAAETRRHK